MTLASASIRGRGISASGIPTQIGRVMEINQLAEARQLAGLDPKRIIAAVSAFYGLEEASLSRRHDPHLARPVAAWLCRCHTEASLREMAEWLGLSRADSVPTLTRRLEARLKTSPELSADLTEILKPANEPTPAIGPASKASTRAPRRSAPPKTKNKA
jgi:chromosomal replication initiation ATPase DnaA